MIANIASNPILSIIAFIEITVIFTISVFVRVLIGGGIPRFTGAGAVILIVEEKSQSFYLGIINLPINRLLVK